MNPERLQEWLRFLNPRGLEARSMLDFYAFGPDMALQRFHGRLEYRRNQWIRLAWSPVPPWILALKVEGGQ